MLLFAMPLSVNTIGELIELQYITKFLLKYPISLGLISALMIVLSPGFIGCLSHITSVHPHDSDILVISSGLFPLFVTLKTVELILSLVIVPKL